FLRLAAWTPDSGSYRVLSQQVTPLRVSGQLDLDLNAVRDKLMPGEVLGLLVQGHSDQFHFSDSHLATSLSVAGKIGLPLASANDATPYDWRVTGQR
ncbi:MAG: hypothetical protein KGO49_14245, partial [Gammaproteobacteria bacterium]|nr:hypothetical protein [Gammaproteobacteria bacterium]